MEDIFTDSQVHGYSMSYLKKQIVFIVLILLSGALSAQDYSKRAIKLTEKADELIRARSFIEAVEMLKKAIDVDSNYPQPYLKLSTIYNLYQKKDSAAAYYNRALAVIPKEKISEKMWQNAAGMNFSCGNYMEGLAAAEQQSNPDSLLLLSLRFAVTSMAKATKLDQEILPKEINAFDMQYFPVLTVDESKIIYTKRNSNSPSSDEDIFISTRINGEWIPSQSISRAINTPLNEGACTISADGRTLIFTACEGRKSYGSCDLYISYRNGNNWTTPENLGETVNSKYWDSQPALSADGRTLYFSSNRPGGEGKRDLWVTSRTADGWSEPTNLGKPVNTPKDETTPFIHVNGQSLFYSSDGHYGFGGLDLFVTQKTKNWCEPRNLGYPINTMNDEISLFINALGTNGYYASENDAGRSSTRTNIIRFKIPTDTLLANRASYVTGRVLDRETEEPLGAVFKMTNLEEELDSYVVSADSLTGKYFLVLTEGNQYGVFVEKKNYLFEDLTFTATGNSILHPDTIDIYLDPIKPGATVVLENIFFEIDSYKLDAKSKAELNDLMDFMTRNPNLEFLIEGHTDNTGTEAYNNDLSEKRAFEVYDYLVNAGIDKTRIAYKGYGSQKPIASNDTESSRERNRRINVTIIR